MAGMGLRATHNLPEVFAAVDAWAADVLQVAAPEAINKTIQQAQVAGLSKVNDIYRIGPRTIEKYVTVRLASTGHVEAVLTAKGFGFPLFLFNPRQIRGKGGGVEVTIKGRTFFFPHAFFKTQRGKIIAMKSGHVGVFARGAYAGKGTVVTTGERIGRFAFGRQRLPIQELFTFGPAEALSNPAVVDAMNVRVSEQLPKNLLNQIKRFARG